MVECKTGADGRNVCAFYHVLCLKSDIENRNISIPVCLYFKTMLQSFESTAIIIHSSIIHSDPSSSCLAADNNLNAIKFQTLAAGRIKVPEGNRAEHKKMSKDSVQKKTHQCDCSTSERLVTNHQGPNSTEMSLWWINQYGSAAMLARCLMRQHF